CGYDEAMAFIDAGASSVTHMFNAMKPCEKRSPNLPGAAFDAGINAELICDGIHVDKTIVKMAYKLFGRKICLISDSMSAAGLGDGVYDLGGMKVNVTGNKAMHEGVLAGSVANLLSEARNLIGWGISAGDAIYSAAIAPKELLGMDIPSLMPGSTADILVLDKEFGLKKVICKGYMTDAL
nr:N-acetylglucosamine-6-phosphate deacetylase [Saccharofermentans sp.]